MKKNIAILVCGQVRNSDLGNNIICINNLFSNSFKEKVITHKNLEEHNINIFFSVDNINKTKLDDLCGSNLKGIFETDNENINSEINLEEINKNYMNYHYNRKNNLEKFPLCIGVIKDSQIAQTQKFYKVYCGYKLMLNYENKNNLKHDYILLLRPDIFFCSSIDFTCIIEENNFELLSAWDYGFFGKYEIMCHLCNLIKCYGIYNLGEQMYAEKVVSNIIPKRQVDSKCILYNYYTYVKPFYTWCESPEVQIVEHILKYCMEKEIHFDKLNSDMLLYTISLVPDRK